jgi:thiamine-monophosphate kinase
MMKLSDLGEFGLIDRIRKLSLRRNTATLVGIGDDAAALRLKPSSSLLATMDLLIEGIHFDLSYTDYYSLGWKSAAVNLSDIAAMGGTPCFCLTALGIPTAITTEQVLQFYRGAKALLARHKTSIVGGDTCASRRELFISVTALGEARPDAVITRSGARPGDRLFVTNTLGDAAAGLELLRQGVREQGVSGKRSSSRPPTPAERTLLEKHLRPVPRVKEGCLLSDSRCATAMIDISDGLLSDLHHICEQSGVGAVVRAGALPRSRALAKAAQRLSEPFLTYALSGGEDYELLFTVPPNRLRKFGSLRLAATEIGMITEGRSVTVIGEDGKKIPGERKGFDHFAVTAAKRCRR